MGSNRQRHEVMAYKRKFETEAELAAFRSEMAKHRKVRRGGRPKGSTNKGPSAAVPTKTMTVRETDLAVLRRLAYENRRTLTEEFHNWCEAERAAHPELFSL